MALALIKESTLTDIADAIREVADSSDTYKCSEMADALEEATSKAETDMLAEKITGTLTTYSSSIASVVKYAFYCYTYLETIELPSATSIGTDAFYLCSSLTTVELAAVTVINGNAFYNCTSLTSLILSGDTVCSLNASSIFTNTPIAKGTGYIYVPEDLVDSYKEADNWSTYADQIVAIS